MKQEMPARPLPLSVRAKTMPHGASCAREMKTFRPLRTHRSPRLSAPVWVAPAGSGPRPRAGVGAPAAAARLGALRDGAGGVGAARGLGDGEEGLPALANGGHRVLLDLR